jgi:hypothetical protein
MRMHDSCMGFLMVAMLAAATVTASGQTTLSNGVPVTGLSGSSGSQKLFVIAVPSGATSVVVASVGNDPDADLYARWGAPPTLSTYDEKSIGSSSTEGLGWSDPPAGNLYILVHGYQSYTGLALAAQYTGGADIEVVELEGGELADDLDGTTGDERYFKVDVPPGRDWVKVILEGDDPDADIYAMWGDLPTTDDYDKKATTNDSNDTITFNSPESGDLYVLVHAYAGYTNASLRIEWDGLEDGDDNEQQGGAGGPPAITSLAKAVPALNLAGAPGSERLYSLSIPGGQSFASFALSGGTGNADLFVSFNEVPSAANADWQSAGTGASEKVVVTNPPAGTAYILVRGGGGYGGVTLTANFGGWVHQSHVVGPWKNHLMGTCGVKLKDYGCMVACVAMALHRAGTAASPGELNEFLNANGGYNAACALKWNAAASFDGEAGLKWWKSSTLTTPTALKSLLDAGRVVIVASTKYAPAKPHWVIVTGYTGNGSSWSKFTYWDPADATPVTRTIGDAWVKVGHKTRLLKIAH